jgi:hypothetical protein
LPNTGAPSADISGEVHLGESEPHLERARSIGNFIMLVLFVLAVPVLMGVLCKNAWALVGLVWPILYFLKHGIQSGDL